MTRSSIALLVSTSMFVVTPIVLFGACDDALPPAMPVPVTTVSGPASSASDVPSSKSAEPPTGARSEATRERADEKPVTCGDATCKKGQQCCTGGSLRKPTCFDGAVCPR